MPIEFSQEDIDNIIKLRTIDNLSIKKIGEVFGVGYKPIARVISANGIPIKSNRIIEFTSTEKQAILNAYDSGIGCKGINTTLGLSCGAAPVIRFLKSERGPLRDRGQQQQARMDRSTSAQKKALTNAANMAATGRVRAESEKIKAARTMEGRVNPRSKYEGLVLDALNERFDNVIPSKAINIYNADFAIGRVTVEVFGGGWSVSNRRRIEHYIRRTKEIGKLGYHVIFIVLRDSFTATHASKLMSTIDVASIDPSITSKYWVIWGDLDGSTGFCSDIDDSSFINPSINTRDITTGRYKSVAR